MNTTDYHRPPIRVALMGLGRSMFKHHYPIFKAHPSLFKIVCACDLLKERRDLIAKDFPECRMFRRFDDMLDEQDIDLVDIATPTIDHLEHATKSLGRGFWTLIETPLALTTDDAQVIKGAALKARNRLIVMQRGLFDADFLLAKEMMSDPRLGPIYQLSIRKGDYIRRDDWQCVKRLGGGAAYYAMNDLVLQALKLLPTPPIQMWSELKRVASLGDAEDYAHVALKTREQISADVLFSGGAFPCDREPSFTIRGERGIFRVQPGLSVGELTMIDPDFKFPRRRSSVRTPEIVDLHEDFPLVTMNVELPRGTLSGPSAFWRHVYESVRTGAAFPYTVEDSIEAVKFSHLMKKTSPFGK